jgi:hypothetical protein
MSLGGRPVIHSLFYGVRPEHMAAAITLLASWTEPVLHEPLEQIIDISRRRCLRDGSALADPPRSGHTCAARGDSSCEGDQLTDTYVRGLLFGPVTG